MPPAQDIDGAGVGSRDGLGVGRGEDGLTVGMAVGARVGMAVGDKVGEGMVELVVPRANQMSPPPALLPARLPSV